MDYECSCFLQSKLRSIVSLVTIMQGQLEPGWPTAMGSEGDRIWLLGAAEWGQD